MARFETPAGRKGQVDFATFTLPWGRRHALVTVLSHSRLFLPAADDEVLIEGLESAFRVVRRGAAGTAVRSDAGGGAVGWSCGRRRTGAECGLPAVRRAPGVPGAGMPAVPGKDQGQGGAADPLHPRQLLLRVLSHPALLVVDETGYLPVIQDGAVPSSSSSTPATSVPPPCSPPTRASRNGAVSSATRSWPPLSSTACCTTATSSTSAATATECGSIAVGVSVADVLVRPTSGAKVYTK